MPYISYKSLCCKKKKILINIREVHSFEISYSQAYRIKSRYKEGTSCSWAGTGSCITGSVISRSQYI